MHRWKQLAFQVEHAAVVEMGRKVEADLRSLDTSFLISSDEHDLRYRTHEAALRRWLIEKARQASTKKSSVADELGVSRQTVDTWEKELRAVNAAPNEDKAAVNASLGAPRDLGG